MTRIIQEVEVGVPVRAAYDQWTQFESFPQFMEGIERVDQLDDRTLEWHANIVGVEKHWRAEIVEQRPDELVSWRSTEGARNDGAVRFETLGPDRTRVVVQLDVEPEGPIETVGAALGIVEGRVKGDLERFREFIEDRGRATGSWRGEVQEGELVADDATLPDYAGSTASMGTRSDGGGTR